jgi:hypothetical protein
VRWCRERRLRKENRALYREKVARLSLVGGAGGAEADAAEGAVVERPGGDDWEYDKSSLENREASCARGVGRFVLLGLSLLFSALMVVGALWARTALLESVDGVAGALDEVQAALLPAEDAARTLLWAAAAAEARLAAFAAAGSCEEEAMRAAGAGAGQATAEARAAVRAMAAQAVLAAGAVCRQVGGAGHRVATPAPVPPTASDEQWRYPPPVQVSPPPPPLVQGGSSAVAVVASSSRAVHTVSHTARHSCTLAGRRQQRHRGNGLPRGGRAGGRGVGRRRAAGAGGAARGAAAPGPLRGGGDGRRGGGDARKSEGGRGRSDGAGAGAVRV